MLQQTGSLQAGVSVATLSMGSVTGLGATVSKGRVMNQSAESRYLAGRHAGAHSAGVVALSGVERRP
ncbi:hypothetical protein I6N98_15635 [Spongiibacter nanhainus]|uniref:Uncharacterized protein n=1 Tax=Spongiibacter nanhainus TaxID=2794344 RepID=A0A7T4QZM6_9GAMM|nr:hypothetical protein [Spongiibacter nanhainus]QQD17755.1 hypothetical protein I6N98_15635 [Spongiibacter nanhainus]